MNTGPSPRRWVLLCLAVAPLAACVHAPKPSASLMMLAMESRPPDRHDCVDSMSDPEVIEGHVGEKPFIRVKAVRNDPNHGQRTVYIVCGALHPSKGVAPPPNVEEEEKLEAVLCSGNANGERCLKIQHGFAVVDIIDTTTTGGAAQPTVREGFIRTPWQHIVVRSMAGGAYLSRYVALASPKDGDTSNGGVLERMYQRNGSVWADCDDGIGRDMNSKAFTEIYADRIPEPGFPSKKLLKAPARYSAADDAFCKNAEDFARDVRKQIGDPPLE